MNWRPADDPGPKYSWDQATSDLAICLALEADALIRYGDWNVWS